MFNFAVLKFIVALYIIHMDKNLFLLNREEIEMIQRIDYFQYSLPNGRSPKEFSFFPLRDRKNCPVQLVIDKGDAEEFKKIIDSAIGGLRRIIDEERRRREKTEIEMPILPNDSDSEEPIFPIDDQLDNDDEDWDNWDDDVPEFESDNRLNDWLEREMLDHNEAISDINRIREIDSELRKISNKNSERLPDGLSWRDRCEMESLLDKKEDLIYKLGLEVQNGNMDYDDIESYSNSRLRIIDRQIAEYKWTLQRRNRDLKGMASGIVSYSSSMQLGKFFPKQEGVPQPTVVLFEDVIDYLAGSKPDKRLELISSTYVHEMMHAYYSERPRKGHIDVFGKHEIEEPMAEFGMLQFLNEFDRGSYYTSARAHVDGKLTAPDPRLHCYGLGGVVFDSWMATGRDALIFERYQKVQRSIHNSLVLKKYKKNLNHCPVIARRACARLLLMLNHYDLIVHYHLYYSFNRKQYSFNNHLAYAIVEEYLSYDTSRTFADLEGDFDNRSLKAFIDISSGATSKGGVTVSDHGVVVEVTRAWSHSMIRKLIDLVNNLYRCHKMPDRVRFT